MQEIGDASGEQPRESGRLSFRASVLLPPLPYQPAVAMPMHGAWLLRMPVRARAAAASSPFLSRPYSQASYGNARLARSLL